MRRKKKERPNTERGQLMAKLDDAILVAKRSGVRVPSVPSRYLTVLERLTNWERKLTIAENKVKYYRDKERYYQGRLGI